MIQLRMKVFAFVSTLLLALPASAAFFSFEPQGPLEVPVGSTVVFDVFYFQEAADPDSQGVNLRIAWVGPSGGLPPLGEILPDEGSSNTNGNPFEMPLLDLFTNSDNPALPQNVTDIGGGTISAPPVLVNALGGVRLGEVGFSLEIPGEHFLFWVPQTSGSRDANFDPIPLSMDLENQVLARIVAVREPTAGEFGLLSLLLVWPLRSLSNRRVYSQ